MMSKQKKIMLLGGIYYLKPVIEAAHQKGYYVITADYLPNNVAHRWSDEYVNVSIVDKEAVLKAAQELQIDAIMSFAVDPGVVSAAYVAEKMGLPFPCSYKTACILQDKAKFRAFLAKNGFCVPAARGYSNIASALDDKNWWKFPVIVKPTDSAGSKGVTRVDSLAEYEPALEYAFGKSISGRVVVESFLEKEGRSSGFECFVVDGKLVYRGIYDQYFDEEANNSFTPAGEYWPSVHSQQIQEQISAELQRFLTLIDAKTGLFNVEWRVAKDGNVYLMEVSPRAGGNRLAELILAATGTDLISASLDAAVGVKPAVVDNDFKSYWLINVLHANNAGHVKEINIDASLEKNVVELSHYVRMGDSVCAFSGANDAVGSMFLKFDEKKALETFVLSFRDLVRIITD